MDNELSELLPHEAERNPIVTVRDGEAFANSRDIAAFFGKRHDNVLRAIDDLLSQDGSSDLRSLFLDRIEHHDAARREVRSFDMTRDGFSLLAMGFTGSKALKWKLRYIAAFNAMETEMKRHAGDALAVLSDPAAMRGLLLTYAEKQLRLEQHVSELAPKAEALSRIAESDGSFCITDAAKTLQVQPKALFSFLRAHRWIYTRAGAAGDIAYQDKLASGLLEHKTTTVARSDGTEKTVTQVRVTPKGLTRLAQEFPPAVRAA